MTMVAEGSSSSSAAAAAAVAVAGAAARSNVLSQLLRAQRDVVDHRSGRRVSSTEVRDAIELAMLSQLARLMVAALGEPGPDLPLQVSDPLLQFHVHAVTASTSAASAAAAAIAAASVLRTLRAGDGDATRGRRGELPYAHNQWATGRTEGDGRRSCTDQLRRTVPRPPGGRGPHALRRRLPHIQDRFADKSVGHTSPSQNARSRTQGWW